ncbi:MAG: hypothetical protein ACREUW_04575 [Burkholderiales bacterium]
MTDPGVEVPPPLDEPPRAWVIIASVIRLGVSLPFFYLAYLYWHWQAVFADWRGWVFAATAAVCVLMATVVPPRHRLAIVRTRVRWWGRSL